MPGLSLQVGASPPVTSQGTGGHMVDSLWASVCKWGCYSSCLIRLFQGSMVGIKCSSARDSALRKLFRNISH